MTGWNDIRLFCCLMLSFTLKTNNECFGSADGEVKKMLEFILILVVRSMKCPAALSTSQNIKGNFSKIMNITISIYLVLFWFMIRSFIAKEKRSFIVHSKGGLFGVGLFYKCERGRGSPKHQRHVSSQKSFVVNMKP